MKRGIAVALIAVGAAWALRQAMKRAGPRILARCEEMFARMPEEFPPRRMMRNLEIIREQTRRILEMLEERRGAPTAESVV